jgi:hypothetical protein
MVNTHESYKYINIINFNIYIYILLQNLEDGGQLIWTLDIQFSSDFNGEDEEPTEDQVSPFMCFFGGQQI